MRATFQHRVILDTVRTLGNHPSAEQVYDHVITIHPTIGKSTVYRNLGQMVDSGKLINIGKFNGITRYDHNTHAHYHFECNHCHCIFDVEGFIDDMGDRVRAHNGFMITSHDVIFRGLCSDCNL